MSPAAMNLLARWWRFNLVGVIGFAVQMTALTLLRRICRTHYLPASAAAVELTLLHNFLWHLRFTWRDRIAKPMAQLVRFHLSNGLVSLVGNLLVVRLLVRNLHLPLLAANAIAVLACAVANFYLGDRWAFSRRSGKTPPKSHSCKVVGPPGLEPGTNGL